MAAPKIEKLLTPYNFTNKDNAGRIKYIVIHYVGALGGAEANCKYYASKYLGASAHYFVGFNGEVWQSVEDEDIAWHCGASSYKHAECRNSNSIGIEMCVRNKGSQSAEAEQGNQGIHHPVLGEGIQQHSPHKAVIQCHDSSRAHHIPGHQQVS